MYSQNIYEKDATPFCLTKVIKIEINNPIFFSPKLRKIVIPLNEIIYNIHKK